jgi:hypothetical protein
MAADQPIRGPKCTPIRHRGKVIRPARLGSLPVAFGAKFDIQRTQVLPPEIVQRREFVLAARVVQPPDGQLAALSVDQPEEPPGVQRLGDVIGAVGLPPREPCAW